MSRRAGVFYPACPSGMRPADLGRRLRVIVPRAAGPEPRLQEWRSA
jgi:hypothetical protein